MFLIASANPFIQYPSIPDIIIPTVKKDPKGHWIRLVGQNDHGPAPNYFLASATCETQLTEGQSWTNAQTGLRGKITGFVFPYTWKSLEPSLGSYNLGPGSNVDDDIAWCAANQVYYIIMIEDRTFTGSVKPLPLFMDSLAPVVGGLPSYPLQLSFITTAGNGVGQIGYCGLRHKPEYAARMKALCAKIAFFYDDPNTDPKNAWFAGVSFQETSMGSSITGNDPFTSAPDPIPAGTYHDTNAGYSAQAYKDSLIDYLGDADNSLNNSRIYWMQNSLAGNNKFIGDVVTALAPNIRVGGPDLMPDRTSFTGGAVGEIMPTVGTGVSDLGVNSGKPPAWSNKTGAYNWYSNGWATPTDAFHTQDTKQPLGAIQLGAGTFCTVSGDAYHDPMKSNYNGAPTANGGLGSFNTGTSGNLWQAGDLVNWGRRNLGLDSVWWYPSDIGTNNDSAKAIAANPAPFSHTS